MLNLVSLVIGVVGLILALIAFLPFIGFLNWLILPIPIAGAVIGMLSRKTSGRNLNLVVILIAVVRLSIGGGIF